MRELCEFRGQLAGKMRSRVLARCWRAVRQLCANYVDHFVFFPHRRDPTITERRRCRAGSMGPVRRESADGGRKSGTAADVRDCTARIGGEGRGPWKAILYTPRSDRACAGPGNYYYALQIITAVLTFHGARRANWFPSAAARARIPRNGAPSGKHISQSIISRGFSTFRH